MKTFEDLKGKTITKITRKEDNEKITFETSDGWKATLYHEQECCEHVRIEDIIGDLDDLLHSPILIAEEATEYNNSKDSLWTFYKLATVKGYVTIRWLGESEYYSIDVNFKASQTTTN